MGPLSRRNFVKAGGTMLTVPFLGSLPRMAKAATASPSGSLKRLLFFNLTNSWYDDVIFPKNPTYLTGPEGVRYLPLSSIPGDISQMFTAGKYGNLKSKMNMLRGLDLQSAVEGGGGHRSMYALGATDERSPSATKSTIDTIISASSAFYPVAPFKKVMNAVAASGNDSWRYNYSSTSSYLEGPSQIFAEYFANTVLSGPGATPVTPPDTNFTRRIALDAALAKVNGLASSNRLSTIDRQKLAEHAEMVNRLLPTLAAPTGPSGEVGASCFIPGAPGGINSSMSSSSGNGNRLKACMDLIYMAFNCQLTNLVVFHPIIAADNESLPMGDDSGDKYHQIAGHHHQIADYLKYKGFVFDQLLYLLNKMDAQMESNGLSMLDNSLVVVVSNDGCSIHSNEDIPVITFGKLGGAIKAGNYINFQRTDAPSGVGGFDGSNGGPSYTYRYNLGRPYNSFFTTLLNALKIPHTGFGEYGSNKSTYAPFVTATAKQASLPLLT